MGAAKLNQISLMVNFMLLESGGGGMRGRSFFSSSDSTPSSYRIQQGTNHVQRDDHRAPQTKPILTQQTRQPRHSLGRSLYPFIEKSEADSP